MQGQEHSKNEAARNTNYTGTRSRSQDLSRGQNRWYILRSLAHEGKEAALLKGLPQHAPIPGEELCHVDPLCSGHGWSLETDRNGW